jgi:hypothetical protein
MKDKIIGPLFFKEATITGDMYLDMLEQFVYFEVANLQLNIIYQQDAHPHTGVCLFKNPSMTPSWIIGFGATDQSLWHHICWTSLL